MKCAGCLKTISKEECVACSVKTCSRVLHATCANARSLTTQQKEDWICPDCRANIRKGGGNTNTPISTHDNVTFRKKTMTSSEPNQDYSNYDLITEIRSLRQDMATLQSDFNKRLDDLLSKFDNYEKRLKSLEQKEKENETLRIQVAQLQEQINKQSHRSLQSEIEILGITETPGENPYHLALTTANKIGIKLEEQDLDYVSRAGAQKNSKPDSNHLPRPLVVSFTRRIKREELLKEAKLRRKLDSQEIVGSGPQRKVFVNERLTHETRQLFRAARNWSREHGYRYCWVRNGSVYVRKREGREGSPPIHIQQMADLEALSGSHTARD